MPRAGQLRLDIKVNVSAILGIRCKEERDLNNIMGILKKIYKQRIEEQRQFFNKKYAHKKYAQKLCL
jgi:hypothetical protein